MAQPSNLSRRRFLTALGGAGLAAISGAHAAAQAPQGRQTPAPSGSGDYFAYIGGYTRHGPPGGAGNAEGLSIFRINGQTGAARLLNVFVDIDSPSFIALSADKTRLYAVSEIDDYNKAGEGCVTAFAVNAQTGMLEKLNTVASGGAVPAHISIHPSGRFVFTANYTGGSVAVFPLDGRGALKPASDIIHNSGPLMPPRAENNPIGNFAVSDHGSAHPHMIAATPDGAFVLINDAGLDRVYIRQLDTKTGKLTPAPANPYYSLTPGSAPRHFVFNSAGNLLYNLCEQNSEIVVSQFSPAGGALTPIQNISTLPAGFQGSNLAAEILISGDDRFIYSSNRLRDTVTVFAAAANGSLTQKGEVWSKANYIRAMALSPDERFLFCAGQRSDSVSCLARDAQTGNLTATEQLFAAGTPSCFAFVPVQA